MGLGGVHTRLALCDCIPKVEEVLRELSGPFPALKFSRSWEDYGRDAVH